MDPLFKEQTEMAESFPPRIRTTGPVPGTVRVPRNQSAEG